MKALSLHCRTHLYRHPRAIVLAAFIGYCANSIAAEPANVETVTVTGSRLRRDAELESPVPTVAVDGESIANNGATALGDVLFALPQAFVNSNSQSNPGTSFNAGQSRVDLRGIGAARTLVLVDGRRQITGDFRAPAMDLNTLPTAMIERVEVISGGASAVYGSEAIAGVVNISLRNHLQGLSVDSKIGTTEEGDGNEWQLSAAYGLPFASGRGHAVVSGEWGRVGSIYAVDRHWAYPGIRRDTNVSPQPVLGASRTNAIPTATFQLVGGSNTALQRSVSIAPDYSTLNVNSAACRTATVTPNCQDPWLFYSTAYSFLQGPSEKRIARAYFDYQIAHQITWYADVSHAQNDGMGSTSPAFSAAAGGGTLPVRIFGDNAYLNGTSALAQQLRTAWTGAGLALAHGSSAQVGKIWDELGRRDIDVRRQTTRAATGLKGNSELWNRDVNWQTYAQFSELDGRVIFENVPNVLRVQQATDAVTLAGQIVCNDATARAAGCVPWNLINGPSAAAVDWVNASARFDGVATQTIVAANAETALFELPAGALRTAIGAEYRDETSDFRQDPLSASGALFTSAIGRTEGKYHVSEAYLEAGIPVLKDIPGIEYLSVEAAGRVGSYSSVGHVDQWRVQSTWVLIRDLSFRASLAKAVRAPNITEAYGPRSQNSTTAANDPCDRAQITAIASDPARQARRIANCAATISSYNPNTFNSNIGSGRPSLSLIQGGNPNLIEESANTFTVGFVTKPRWINNLMLSLDYWRIDIDDYIGTVPINSLLSNLCYDSGQAPADNRFCSLIHRDSTTGGINLVELTSVNATKLETSGFDLAIQYDYSLGALGKLSTRIDAAKVRYWDLQSFAGAPTTHFLGVISSGTGIPQYKVNAALGWSTDRWHIEWQTRFQDSYAVSEVDPPSSRDPFYTGNYFEHDVRGTYRINDDVMLRAGIVNVTDATPPMLPEIGLANGGAAASFDNRGRWYYVGFNYAMGHK